MMDMELVWNKLEYVLRHSERRQRKFNRQLRRLKPLEKLAYRKHRRKRERQ